MATRVGRELLHSPLPDIVERLGSAIAQAQHAMDRTSLAIAALMGDREEHGVSFSGEDEKRSLLELGFTPTFYHITEATVEAHVAFSMAQSTEVSVSVGVKAGVNVGIAMVAATVNASYTNRYSFEATGSSAVTAKFVAVPAPANLTTLLATRAGGRAGPDTGGGP